MTTIRHAESDVLLVWRNHCVENHTGVTSPRGCKMTVDINQQNRRAVVGDNRNGKLDIKMVKIKDAVLKLKKLTTITEGASLEFDIP